MNEFKRKVGQRIKQKRLSLALTREEFAEAVGISSQFLCDVEHCRKSISIENLYKIKIALGVSADWLLEGDESEKDS